MPTPKNKFTVIMYDREWHEEFIYFVEAATATDAVEVAWRNTQWSDKDGKIDPVTDLAYALNVQQVLAVYAGHLTNLRNEKAIAKLDARLRKSLES